MSDEMIYGGSDINAGARKHKMTVLKKDQSLNDINKPAENQTDITKSDMFLKLFGTEVAGQFQKMEVKKQMERPRVISSTLKEAHNEPDSSGSKR